MTEEVYANILFDYASIMEKFQLAPNLTLEQIKAIDSISLMDMLKHAEDTCRIIVESAGYEITSSEVSSDISSKVDISKTPDIKMWKATNKNDETINISLVTVVGIHAILIHIMKDIYEKYTEAVKND